MTKRAIRSTAILALLAIVFGTTFPHLSRGAKPQPPPPPPAKYVITDLSSFSGSVRSEAYQINNLPPDGVVAIAGLTTNTTSSNSYAAIWEASSTGSVLSLDTVPLPADATFSTAIDVNDSGLVVGNWTIPGIPVPTRTAYADVPGVGLSVLSTEDSFAAPRSVNNHGVVVDAGGVLRLVSPDGTVDTVGYLESNFDPWDINDQGVVAGILDFQPAIAWLDENLVPHSQTLPVLRGCTEGAAMAINNLNQVVGYCVDPHGSSAYYRAFVWDPAGGVKAIGDFGGNYAVALDINDRGQVVGLALPKESSVSHAFLWENGRLSDLNTLAAAGSTRSLRRADGINNDGRIVGSMITTADPLYHGFLLSPTP